MFEHSTPEYYRLSPEEDLLHWCARVVPQARWAPQPDAQILHLLWFNLLRYVLRLPFKGPHVAAQLSDIDKAQQCLAQLREALASAGCSAIP